MEKNVKLSSGYVVVFDDVVEPDFCQRIIGKMASSADKCTERTTDALGTVNNLQELRIWEIVKEDEEWQAIDTDLFNVFGAALKRYAELYPAFPRVEMQDYGYIAKKYLKDIGEYATHIDRAGLQGLLSFTLFLNTVESGGQLAYSEQGVNVPPVVGRLVVAPVQWTHPHKNHVPAGVDKYVIKTFFGFNLQENK